MRVYIRLAFMEVNIFCFIGLYCFGSGYGFEYLLFTIIVMFFYSGYFAKRLHKKLHVGWYAMISAFVLTFFHFHLIMRGSYYTLTEHWIQHLFFTFHSLGSVILIVVFLTELTNYVVKLERLILHQSVTDELTDINNRNGALDKFTDLQNTNQLNNYALLMLDIDDFKKFNDTYGHDCGDLALKTLAKHLNDFAGTTCAARWGGEEFIAFINTKNLPLEHVRDFLKLVSEDEIDYNGNKLHITVTIGISTYKKYTNLTDWVIEADRALYEGKDTGKNRIIIK